MGMHVDGGGGLWWSPAADATVGVMFASFSAYLMAGVTKRNTDAHILTRMHARIYTRKRASAMLVQSRSVHSRSAGLIHLDGGLERRENADTDHCRQDVAALCPTCFQAEVDVNGDDEGADDGAGHEGAGGELGRGGGEWDGGWIGIGSSSSITLLLLLLNVMQTFAQVRAGL